MILISRQDLQDVQGSPDETVAEYSSNNVQLNCSSLNESPKQNYIHKITAFSRSKFEMSQSLWKGH